MAHLPDDVMLLICEHLDASSILSFMLTCRHLHHLLKFHESSITKGWISKMITNPRVAFPLGAILSSQVQEMSFHELNRITLSEGFEVIAEIDSRERKIEALFAQTTSGNHLGFGPLRSALDETKFISGLSRRQTSRLVEGLKDACRVANRISDYAASALTTEEIIAARRAYILEDTSPLDLAVTAQHCYMRSCVIRPSAFRRPRANQNERRRAQHTSGCGSMTWLWTTLFVERSRNKPGPPRTRPFALCGTGGGP